MGSRQKLISIFVCGVQKGGTTSLDAHMREHPALSPPLLKEIHFFDDEAREWVNPDYSMLGSFFVAEDGCRQRFEATPIYSFWPPSIERIHTYNPTAKLIFLFRDPLERAWSHWRMEYASGYEVLPFAAAIREGRRRLDGIPILAPQWRVYSYVERGLYADQVRRALRYFPRDQLLFLRSEDLEKSHVLTLRHIAGFLKIEEFPRCEAKRKNIGPDEFRDTAPTDEDKAYIKDVLGENLSVFSTLAGLDISNWPTASP